jgi:hypothetical protein
MSSDSDETRAQITNTYVDQLISECPRTWTGFSPMHNKPRSQNQNAA